MSIDDMTNRPEQARHYKGIEELDGSPEVSEWNGEEFPHRRSIPEVNRRDVLKLIGGSIALAGLGSGCRFLPEQKIVPFVNQPEDIVAGKSRSFASAWSLGGYATGILVESVEGRPIKIEGNPLHPASLGSCSSWAMAEMLNLYDPDRLQVATLGNDPANWRQFLAEARKTLQTKRAEGDKIILLTETVNSPVLAKRINDFLAKHPNAEWRQYEPVNRDNVREGAMLAFGRDVETQLDFSRAKVVLSVDSDFMLYGPAPVLHSRQVMQNRRVEETGEMNRIYAVEAFPSLCGAVADHRLPIRPTHVVPFLRALAAKLGAGGTAEAVPGVEDKWLSALAKDLQESGGEAVVVVGQQHGPAAHAMAHVIHQAIGAVGKTVAYTEPTHSRPVTQANDLAAVAQALEKGEVKMILVLGGNPCYTSPADAKLSEGIRKAPFSAHLSLHDNETTWACQWHLPESHFLESWGDAVSYDGTISIVQPLIEPMYDSKSILEFMDALLGTSRNGLDIVREFWRNRMMPGVPSVAPGKVGDPFDAPWREALAKGVLPNTKAKPVAVSVSAGVESLAANAKPAQGIEVVFLPDPTVYDGRYANNGWLQELPKPITNFTWDNAFFMSQAMAEKNGLDRKSLFGSQELNIPAMGYGRPLAEVAAGSAKSTAPVAGQMGMAEETIVFHLGYGRTRGGQIAAKRGEKEGGGFNANELRRMANLWILDGATLAKTGKFYTMANVQFHNTLDVDETDSGRYIIQETFFADMKSGGPKKKEKVHWGEKHEEGEHGGEGHSEEKPAITMYDPKEFDFSAEHAQWAMTIDLNLCTGCGACVTACQSENNIPVVGKEQVQKGREMHWIRIDRYYQGEKGSLDRSNPPIRFQPLTCMHCEKAPCEPVCPVAATVHSKEGINQMVYNRCVGTRYCSNNCPYKVRRFNFLHYTDKTDKIPVMAMLQNPDVSVRGRGVMEKCTFCVQRINKARIAAKKETREIKDGEIVTACQSACPTQAIIFGDKRKAENAVAKSMASKRKYVLLPELNTIPRVQYLMRVNNPNPEIEA